MKQSLLQSIYNYYYRMAKQDVLGAELIPEGSYFTSMAKAYKYFLAQAETYYNKQKKDA